MNFTIYSSPKNAFKFFFLLVLHTVATTIFPDKCFRSILRMFCTAVGIIQIQTIVTVDLILDNHCLASVNHCSCLWVCCCFERIQDSQQSILLDIL